MAALEGRVVFLGQALQTLVRDYAPAHLQEAVTVRVTAGATRFTLNLQVDATLNPAQKYGTRDAAAQEYGQGDRSERTPQWKDGVGVILPVNGTHLVFEGTHDYEGQLIVTTAVTKHPGMYPYQNRGYVRPAITEFKTTVQPTLDPDIRNAVRISIRKSFPGAR